MKKNDNNINFLFGGTCTVAGIPFDMSLRSEDGKVVFGGRLLPGTVLYMGEVIEKLSAQFGISYVPEPVRSLELKDLGLTYNSVEKKFRFICTGSFAVGEGSTVEMSVGISITKGDDGSSHTAFSGTITIGSLQFNVLFDTNNHTKNTFVATYCHRGDSPGVSLHNLIKSVSETCSNLIPESLNIDPKEIKFVYSKDNNQGGKFLFSLLLSAGIDLKNIPVVGDKLPDNITLSIESLQVLFASASYSKEEICELNSLLPPNIQPLSDDGMAQGLYISGKLHVLEYTIPIDIGNKEEKHNKTSHLHSGNFRIKTDFLDSGISPLPAQIKWFDIQKKIGPVSFQRIGINFSGDTGLLSFALDASLALGPVQLTMSELTVGSPLSAFEPVFGLQGFFMLLKTSQFELGGGFLRSVSDGVDSYYGTVLAKAGTFSFTALGGHTPSHKDKDDPKKIIPASFFIYANIEIPIGGPPYLNVKGLAGGFGLNNRLKLPTLQELPGYILLPGPGSKAPKQESTPEATIKSVLPQMQKYFIPEQGQYWMAAGISFSSFQMIDVFAVVTVSFGIDFQVALIGSCSMALPKGNTTPVAYIEISFMASYTPATGLLAVEGIISPASYIFGDFCHLTGGFAFYVWVNPPATVAGPRAGDFLVSIGGYHQDFDIPKHYPQLSRLAITFNLSPLKVKGEAYFAMTPGLMMAGGRLDAVWEKANVKAWFNLGIDFVIAWAPFKYYVSGFVNIGCSVNLGLFTLDASVGAAIEVWGPPFGGKANVDLDVVKFTISFGQQKKANPPLLTWSEFKEQFLPKDNSVQGTDKMTVPANSSNILKGMVNAGLNKSDGGGLHWVIDSDYFAIRILTFIPANRLRMGDGKDTYKDIPSDYSAYNHSPYQEAEKPHLIYNESDSRFSSNTVWNPEIHIKPMGKNKLDSVLDAALFIMNSDGEYTSHVTALTVRPVVEDAAGALWNEYTGKTEINSPAFLQSALTGLEISPVTRIPSVVNNVPIAMLLFQQGNKYLFSFGNPAVDKLYRIEYEIRDNNNLDITIQYENDEPYKMVNKEYILSSVIEPVINERRNTVLHNLADIGFEVYHEADMECFGTQTALTNWPEILKLGDYIVE